MSDSLLANATAPINITFNEIPFNIQVPGVYVEIAPSYDQSGLVGYQAATLLMVPVLPTGSLAPLVPTQVFTPQWGSALLGSGGIGDAMTRATIAANPWNPLYVMALPSPGAALVAATGTIEVKITGTLTLNATAAIAIAGVRYSVGTVSTIDSGNSVAANLVSLITADPDCPVTAVSAAGTITLTSKYAGTGGNNTAQVVNPATGDATPAGMTLAVMIGGTAETSGNMAGGSGGAAPAKWLVQAQITSSLTVSGTHALYINGVAYPVPVTVGVDNNDTIATALFDLINSSPLAAVWAADCSGGYVTMLAKDPGTIGNQIDVRFNLNPGDAYVPGVGHAITFTPGTGAHSVAAAFAAIPTFPCTDIICPWNDGTSAAALSAELDRRFGAMVEYDAVAFGAFSETTITALLADTAGLNSRFASYLGVQHSPTPPYLLAAMYGGVAAFNLLNDPARQLRTLALPGAVAPQQADVLINTERQALLTGGMATLTDDRDGSVRIERAVTTYQYAAGNIPDASYRDIMTAKVVQRIRYDWRNYVKLVYPRSKMAADGTLAAEYDDQIVTPRRMQSSWAARCSLYEKLGWIQNSAVTAAASVFQLDLDNPNQMDAVMQLQIMNNLMIFAGRIEFSAFAPTTGNQG